MSIRRAVSSRMNAEELLMGWSCIFLIFEYVGMSSCLVIAEN